MDTAVGIALGLVWLGTVGGMIYFVNSMMDRFEKRLADWEAKRKQEQSDTARADALIDADTEAKKALVKAQLKEEETFTEEGIAAALERTKKPWPPPTPPPLPRSR